MSSPLLYSDCYGDVYKTLKEEKFYLVKIIKSNNLKSKEQNETLNSMKNLSLYINPNLSEYIDFFFNKNGDLEILMEYEEDSEFESKINYNKINRRTFEEDYIWSLTIQLLKLLKYIQQNKDITIDINPAKILLMNNGSLKIFDYGMDLIANMGLSSSILQKINYITPPEYIKDEIKLLNEDAANIWRAGCIIYELCTLNHLFEFESMFDMEVKLSNFKDNFKISINNKYSNDFNILLSKMLIIEPEKRATIDELLNCGLITKRNNAILEKENLEKKLINASIFTFKQSLLKSSLKESIRQIKNQNEMLENDNYEILKFTLSKNKELNDNDKNIDYLKQTGFFGNGKEKEEENNIIINDDFKKKLIEEKKRKENENLGIIEKNNYNYNNPYRINNYIQNKDDLKKPNKIKLDNYIKKERDKTPLFETKNKRYFLDIDKNNINSINNKNKSKPKNKENKNKDILPKINNPFAPNKLIHSKDWKKSNNNYGNNNNLVKKAEQVMKFKLKKVNKIDDTNKIKRPINNNKLGSMTNAQIDAILNNILHKQNVNLLNKIQKNSNIINNNTNRKNMNINKLSENKIKIKAIPPNQPMKNIPNILNNPNNKNTKITYGTVEYKSSKGKKTKFFVKK